MLPDPDFVATDAQSRESIVLVLKQRQCNDDESTHTGAPSKHRKYAGVRTIMERIKEVKLEIRCIHQESAVHTCVVSAPRNSLIFLDYALRNEMCKVNAKGVLTAVSEQTLEDLPLHSDPDSFFTPAEKVRILWSTLDKVHILETDEQRDHLVSQDSSVPYLLRKGKKVGVVEAAYPLHNEYQLHKIKEQWVTSLGSQPLDRIRDYFGEKVAFYFAFLGHYTSMLLYPCVAAALIVVVDVYLSGESVFDAIPGYFISPSSNSIADAKVQQATHMTRCTNVIFTLFIIVWSIFIFKLWTRKESRLALRWGVFDSARYGGVGSILSKEKSERQEFRAQSALANPVYIIDERGKQKIVENAIVRMGRRWLVSYPIMLCCISFAFLFMFMCERIRHYIEEELESTMVFDEDRDLYVQKVSSADAPYYKSDANVETANEIMGHWNVSIPLVGNSVMEPAFSFLNTYILWPVGVVKVFFINAFSEHIIEADELSSWMVFFIKLAPIIGYGLVLPLIDMINFRVAHKLTDFENHRTKDSHERSLHVKLITGQLLNNFMGPLYIAFVQRNLATLRNRLVILFLVRQLVQNIQEVVLPLIIAAITYKFANPTRKKSDTQEVSEPMDVEEIRKQRALPEYSQYDDVLEMLVQFGYVVLFASVFPLGSIAAFLNNLMEIRSDAYKICHSQRTKGETTSKLSSWSFAFNVVAHAGVLTNVGILGIAFAQRDDQHGVHNCIHFFANQYCLETVQLLLVAVAVEHFLLLAQWLVWSSLRPIPKDVRTQLKIKNSYEQTKRDAVFLAQGSTICSSSTIDLLSSTRESQTRTKHFTPARTEPVQQDQSVPRGVTVPLSVFSEEVRRLPEHAMSSLGSGLRKRCGPKLTVDLER